MAVITVTVRGEPQVKALVGPQEAAEAIPFWEHAVTAAGALIVPDAAQAGRSYKLPPGPAPASVRFFAGHVLRAPCGEDIGTLCIMDTAPRAGVTETARRQLAVIALTVMDRLDLLRAHDILVAGRNQFENIATTSPDAIICCSARGQVKFWNKAAESLFGYVAAEIRELSIASIIPDGMRRAYRAEFNRLLRRGPAEPPNRTIQLLARRKGGGVFPVEFSVSTWEEDGTFCIGAIVRDISERQANEERLLQLASHDPLTGLPNRSTWHACVTDVIAGGAPATVMLLDLDGFKTINDTLGHSVGDAVLQEVAARLVETCGSVNMVARLGGDEFVLLLTGDDECDAQAYAAQLVAALSRPYRATNGRKTVGVSVGIAFAPQDGRSCEELLNACDLALLRAKAAGKGRHDFFTPDLRQRANARRAFEHELRHAFENGEFEMFYQPQVSTHDRRLTGAEALIRWNHPERGLLTPAAFIEVLSQKPSADAVGEWTIRTACRQAAQWRKIIPSFRLGVNLFDAQFKSGRLLGVVEDALKECALAPDALELEIVENVLLQNDSKTIDLLHALRGLGVGLAFDDYGTGFASLSLLKTYPVTRLKIDRSFVRNMATDREDAAVVKAVLFLAENFGLDVIAEGVEQEEQFRFLHRYNCHEAQGYLFGRPVSAKDFAAALPPVAPRSSTQGGTAQGGAQENVGSHGEPPAPSSLSSPAMRPSAAPRRFGRDASGDRA
ncbi:EAL domain-containing protein [Xanthobacter sp. KR7-65]|uniref:putative bifunctional diguanylate cyclase/phosphodiesterase n=1 Tax=Xanthobacter sp. KR7-65 TaxID=3156612 RepID=UPI0032B42773